MANVKISALPAATTPLAGTEEIPLVQSATTKKATIANINSRATLQQVTAGTNKDLTNGRNLQGTDAGNGNTGNRVNAIGGGALKNNTGNDVNALGQDAGVGNSFASVNFLGNNTVADADQQTVFGNFDGTTTLNARLSYKNISDNRKYELPDASGTLVLSVNGNAPDPQGNVVVSGGGGPQVATVNISSAQLLTISTSPITIVAAQGANKVIVPMQVIYNYKVVTTGYSGSSLVMQLGSPPVSIGSGFSAYLASTPVVTSQSANITNANSTNLVNTNLILTSFSNPIGGDSTLEVTVIYNVITV